MGGIKITIGGDFCVTAPYTSFNIFSEELIEFFRNSDINVMNLECPITETDNIEKILKTGPHLHTNNNVYNLLKQINIHVLTLANNHILDYGTKGLISTINGCNSNGILTTGAGRNIKEASAPVIIDRNGVRIAFINFCEHEFSIAAKTSPGANPLDLIDNIKDIRFARNIADFVLVIIHGGHEHYNLPSPRMVKQYRFFAENGADAVIGHHTHCISGYEIHNDVPIFYSLGNFLFTMPCKHKGWNDGLIVQFEAKKGYSLKWELMPIHQSIENFKISLSSNDDHKIILEDISHYSTIISNEERLNFEWELYAKKMESQILNDFSPINILPGRYFKSILRRFGLNKIIFRAKYVIPLLNLIECESLHDLSKYTLNSKKL